MPARRPPPPRQGRRGPRAAARRQEGSRSCRPRGAALDEEVRAGAPCRTTEGGARRGGVGNEPERRRQLPSSGELPCPHLPQPRRCLGCCAAARAVFPVPFDACWTGGRREGGAARAAAAPPLPCHASSSRSSRGGSAPEHATSPLLACRRPGSPPAALDAPDRPVAALFRSGPRRERPGSTREAPPRQAARCPCRTHCSIDGRHASAFCCPCCCRRCLDYDSQPSVCTAHGYSARRWRGRECWHPRPRHGCASPRDPCPEEGCCHSCCPCHAVVLPRAAGCRRKPPLAATAAAAAAATATATAAATSVTAPPSSASADVYPCASSSSSSSPRLPSAWAAHPRLRPPGHYWQRQQQQRRLLRQPP